jgi:hypothetical protein
MVLDTVQDQDATDFTLGCLCGLQISALSLCPHARIVGVLDPKGLREGMNRQDAYQEGQKTADQLANFNFSQQALYKRERDLNIKNTMT